MILVTPAKHLLTGLFVSVTLASPGAGLTIRDEALNFEIQLPKGVDWEHRKVTPKSEWKAHFRTYFRNAPTPSEVDLMLMVRRAKPKGTLKEAAQRLRGPLEKAVAKATRRRTSAAELAGEPCLVVDVSGTGAGSRLHLTWRVARRGDKLYVLYARRTNEAIGDPGIEKEIAKIVGTFRFLRPAAPPPPAEPPPKPKTPPPAPRKEYRLPHWRLECVKPAGLREVPPEELDKANGVILRFEGHAEQSRCLVRIYARLRSSSRRLSVDELARRKIARFKKNHAERTEPVTVRWKVPLARRALRLELTARKLTPEVTRWYLADCRNDRQYEIEIITTGEAWEARVKKLLAGFQPRKRLR
ncbi:MAG: hypothetical protein ACYTGU_14890 [Planctomycetota bacterium]